MAPTRSVKVPEEHERISCDESNHTVTISHTQPNVFTFDKVFGPKSSQSELFDESISSMVDEVLNGYPCSVIAYGKKGSGRTYMMEGDKEVGEKLSPNSGIIPRVVSKIFQTLNSQDKLYGVQASIFEIFDDQIIDLLALKDPKRQTQTFSILEDEKGCTNIQGLKEESLYTMKDVYYLLKKGASKRSRSHSMISIKVHMHETFGDIKLTKTGRFLFVTLEGSQKVSGKIDKSLHALDRVINAILKHSVHIPYRDSKLTRLLRDSLSGKINTCIIATISPSWDLKDTLDTLNYVSRLKNIKRKTQEKMEIEHLEGSLNKEIDDISIQIEEMDMETQIKGASFIPAKFESNEHFGLFIASKSSLASDLEYKFKKLKDACDSVSSTLKKLRDKSIQSLEEKSKILLQVDEMQNFLEKACLEIKHEVLEIKLSLDEQLYEAKSKKCIIYAVEMFNKEKSYLDKVNYYVYDDKKIGDIWKESLTKLDYSRTLGIHREKIMIKLEDGIVVEPISSFSRCHAHWSYIVFESHLFRIGGSYYPSEDPLLLAESPRSEYYIREASTGVGILDLKNIKTSNKWGEGPNMNFPRRRPHIFILNGKLYVAGGLFTYDEEVIKDFKFMEVLENGKWVTLPDHPGFLIDRPKYCYPLSKIVTAVIEEKSLILAGVMMEDYTKDYCFHTYKPEDASPKWEPYISIQKDEHADMMIDQLYLKPAVVSGKLMLWLMCGLPNMLYIMDFESEAIYYLNLVEHLLVPPANMLFSKPVLLKVEEGKFGLFWSVHGSKYLSGPEVYNGLYSTIFTLEIKSEEPFVVVEIISSKFSLIPDLSTHNLQAICIGDIEDSMDLTPFNY